MSYLLLNFRIAGISNKPKLQDFDTRSDSIQGEKGKWEKENAGSPGTVGPISRMKLVARRRRRKSLAYRSRIESKAVSMPTASCASHEFTLLRGFFLSRALLASSFSPLEFIRLCLGISAKVKEWSEKHLSLIRCDRIFPITRSLLEKRPERCGLFGGEGTDGSFLTPSLLVKQQEFAGKQDLIPAFFHCSTFLPSRLEVRKSRRTTPRVEWNASASSFSACNR